MMKTVLLLALAAAAAFTESGCVVAVPPPRPVVRVGYTVYYAHGRPYYYARHHRYWGYPPGYAGPVRRERVVVY